MEWRDETGKIMADTLVTPTEKLQIVVYYLAFAFALLWKLLMNLIGRRPGSGRGVGLLIAASQMMKGSSVEGAAGVIFAQRVPKFSR
jgi:hypothetical protein